MSQTNQPPTADRSSQQISSQQIGLQQIGLQQASLQQLVQENSITAGPLPAQQNFTFLKQEGLKQIKSLAGHVWSNYNDSDPGVTILDQVCYALTELGYVNSFPVADVLTQPDGKIDYQQQFFRAEAILTTAPVTLDDYRRLVIDQIPQVDNLYLTPVVVHQQPTGLYQVAIFSRKVSNLSQNMSGPEQTRADDLVMSVHRRLNQQRNVAEYFLLPTLLTPQLIRLSGQILLTQDADAQQVYQQIDQALIHYVSPQIHQQGYQQLRDSGYAADAIFNGPLLDHGWVTGSHPLGDKRQLVQRVDLMMLISGIPGVAAVEQIGFEGDASCQTMVIAADKVAHFLLGDTFRMKPMHTASPAAPQYVLARLHAQHQASPIEAEVDRAPPLPKGRYRDIESYYSIQNTFPDSYGVGENSLQSDAPDYRIAQSRQLKGYLLLFDQVMANQFSQLANLGHLFSFSFGTGASAETALIQRYTSTDSEPRTQAIPPQSFVQTYFYQPLYDVPDVQALLQGAQRYQYFYPDDPEDAKQREKLVWQRFCHDPFNRYDYGLAQAVERSDDAEQRRDTMLSHLLARHGEPADLYNDMIDASQWYGSPLKTRIILKGAWLQNLQALSYRRNQAGDFTRAQPLTTPGRYWLSTQDYQHLLTSPNTSKLAPLLRAIYQKGFQNQKTLVTTLAQARLVQLRAILTRQGTPDKKIHHDQVVKRCREIGSALPLQDGNQRLLENEQHQSHTLMRDGVLDAQALNRFVRLTEQDYADFSVFELKCMILLGLDRHMQTLASALVRLKQTPALLHWLASDPAEGARFPEPFPENRPESDPEHGSEPRSESERRPEQRSSADSDVLLDDISVLRQATTWVVRIGEQPVLVFPLNDAHFGAPQLQQYIDQLDWLSRVRRGFVLVEQTLLQPVPALCSSETRSSATQFSATQSAETLSSKTLSSKTLPSETQPSATQPSTPEQHAVDSGEEQHSGEPGHDDAQGLKATLAFPDYVTLTQEPQFPYFLSVLAQLHWPAHVGLQFRQGDYQQMSVLIRRYCAWYNQQIQQTQTGLCNALAPSVSAQPVPPTNSPQPADPDATSQKVSAQIQTAQKSEVHQVLSSHSQHSPNSQKPSHQQALMVALQALREVTYGSA